MVEPTEVLVELKQVKKQLKQSKEVYVFYLQLFVIMCYYLCLCVVIIIIIIIIIVICIHIFICFPIFSIF